MADKTIKKTKTTVKTINKVKKDNAETIIEQVLAISKKITQCTIDNGGKTIKCTIGFNERILQQSELYPMTNDFEANDVKSLLFEIKLFIDAPRMGQRKIA